MMSNLSALGLNIDHPYPCQGAELQVTTLQSIKGKNTINQGDRENRKCPYGTYGRRTFAYTTIMERSSFTDTNKAKAYMYH